ncbi:hypothetical protein P3X46_030184 [Hevea brasiliensis]|uniref:Uncharacterized protein n=1 Tax=Hevea brasiliensis TaxID=3981 RepID=A0ABQ9KUL3_HEVBR|nr:uncharacterized protein LOC110637019 [Hevea brasiliensis]KAJ9148090.1 hypothetical protein P3X46_030184 [Hevea brasiliensis]
MGNCSVKGVSGECLNHIRVFTDSGGIIQLKGPKLAKDVLKGYPGYGIFRQGNASSPLSSYEYLIGGQFYYLLPLQEMPMSVGVARKEGMRFLDGFESPKLSSGAELVDFGETAENGPAVQVLPSQGHGVWKVKLIINPKQLEEILSEQGNTETLIEKMRMAASSATLEPRQNKSSRGLAWMPSLCSVFKVSPIDRAK